MQTPRQLIKSYYYTLTHIWVLFN